MTVQAHETDIGHSPSSGFHGSHGFLSTQGKPKFGIELTSLDVGMGVGLYTRRDSHKDLHHSALGMGYLLQQLELMKTINHNPTHPVGDSHGQFGRRLVISMEVDPLRWKVSR
jgi:hypothetical protein